MSLDPTELTYDTPALSSREQESPGDVLTKVYKAKYLSVSFTAGSSRTEDSSPSLDSKPRKQPCFDTSDEFSCPMGRIRFPGRWGWETGVKSSPAKQAA